MSKADDEAYKERRKAGYLSWYAAYTIPGVDRIPERHIVGNECVVDLDESRRLVEELNGQN